MNDPTQTPEGWQERTVGELFVLDSGAAPAAFRPGDMSGPVLVYGANGPIGSSTRDNYGPGYLVGRVGAAGCITRVDGRAWASDNTLTATPVKGLCDTRFAEHLLRFLDPTRLATMTAQPLITQGNLSRMRAKVPSVVVGQAAIAAVLDAVDGAIARTEALIAKLKCVCAGLLHDLLTRGLDHNGQLRPQPEDAPDAYQRLEVGLAPRTWTTLPLGEASQWLSGGTPSRSKPEWWTGDFPWLTPKDMKVFELADTSEHVTEEAASVGSKVVPADTVFIVVRGMILAHTFPVAVCTRPFAFNQDIRAIRGQRGLKTRFLAYWLCGNASLFLRKATEATHGTKRLDLGDVLPLRIAFPDSDEQDAILARIGDLDTLLNNEVASLKKLTSLKSGLSGDLLTGRVRVPETILSSNGETA